MDSHLWWHLARASGLTAWLLLSASVLWGLFLSTRVLGGRAAPAWLLDLHRALGALTVVFTAVHMVGLALDRWIGYGVTELFVPFASRFEPAAVAWGVAAMYLLVAVAITSWVRRWIPDLVWRWVHRAAFACFVVATLHTFQAGTDAGNRYLITAAVAICALFLFLCVYRLLAGRRQLAPAPASAAPEATPTTRTAEWATTNGTTFHGLRVSDVRQETADSVSIAFDVPPSLVDQFRFDPGQFLTLRAHIDGVEVRRPYSICSGIADGELRVAVRRVPQGAFSGWITEHVTTGQVVEVMPPQGRFTTTLNPLRSRRVLGVAAGSGITPVLSILRSILTIEPRSHAVLMLGNRDPDSVMLAGEIAAVEHQAGGRLTLLSLYSRSETAPAGQQGRITPDRLRQPDLGRQRITEIDEAFLCGPAAMITEVRSYLELCGVPGDCIHAETFQATQRIEPAMSDNTSIAGALEFTLSVGGVETTLQQATGETVLDAGLRQGLDLPYSCLAGSCGTCIARITDGACDPGYGELTDDQRARGDVMACQARVTSAGTRLEFPTS